MFSLSLLMLAHMLEPDEGPFEDMLRSDVPLWMEDENNVWPQNYDDDEIIGCWSKIRSGIYEYRTSDDPEDSEWYRIELAGIFHCVAMVAHGYERSEISTARAERTLFAILAEQGGADGRGELIIAQIGLRAGSELLLLRRTGANNAFDVLQRKCPEGMARRYEGSTSWRTEYCALNAREDVRALITEMATLPPLGKLIFSEPLEANAED